MDWKCLDLLGTEGKGNERLLSSLLMSLFSMVFRFFYNLMFFDSFFEPWFTIAEIGMKSVGLMLLEILVGYFLHLVLDWFFFINVVVVCPLLCVGNDLSKSSG